MDNRRKVSRLEHVDVWKGMGIILMVLGHMYFNTRFQTWVFAFHMPLFFVVSGYLYKKPTSFRKFAKRKCGSLVKPYLIFGGIYLFYQYFCAGYPKEDMVRFIKGLLYDTTENLAMETALWFFLALLWASLIYALIDMYCRSRGVKLVLVLIITVSGCLWVANLGESLPWGIYAGMSCVGFFHIGHWYRQRETDIKVRVFDAMKGGGKVIIPIIMLVVTIFSLKLIFAVTPDVNVRIGSWNYVPLTYFNATWFTGLFYLLAVGISRKVKGIRGILAFIGRNSVIFMCMNHIALNKTWVLLNRFGAGSWNQVTTVTITFVIAMLGMSLFAVLFNKTPLRWVINK